MNGITYDAAIVGAGPAGTTAAIHLARRGLGVCLIEKETFPRLKVCGGGLTARAAGLLPVPVHPVVHQPCHRVELHFWKRKLNFVARRDRPIIYMVMRAQLDNLLLDEAKKLGVTVYANNAVEDVSEENGRVTILTGKGPIYGRFVIAADGVGSMVARRCGWPANDGAIPALECEVPVDQATLERFRGSARFDLEHPRHGYSWVFPKKEHLSVGVLSMARGVEGLRDSFRAYLDSLEIRPTAEARLHGALIPVRLRPGPPARGRILLAGDAAGLAEPICAEGLSNALLSGELAARAIVDGAHAPDKVVSLYRDSLATSVLRDLDIAGRHARLLYGHSRLQRIMFRLGGEMVCERLTDIIMGDRSIASMGGPWRQLFKKSVIAWKY
ncbi:MAG TPA: NAD(P)/FAD-dependent oxidoreductase [Geobacteraceae bacterium]|nr:NAD(P)/FAD-dependent oxidoreductase [Geobacteraceae bacterium]